MPRSLLSSPCIPALLAALVSSACAQKSQRAEQAAAPPPAATSPTAPAMDSEPAGASSMQTLAGQLAREAAHRQDGGRVEEAFAALAQAGLGLPAPRQYLAAVASADFCAGGTTESGLSISACEYASAREAARAVARTEQRFPQMIGSRTVLFAGRLSVALSAAGHPPDAATVQRVRDALGAGKLAAR